MRALLGSLALWLALPLGLWSSLTGFLGGTQRRPDLIASSRYAVYTLCGALLVAVIALLAALVQHDFNIAYVAAYTSRNLPLFYTWSALYAGPQGSLLCWAALLSLFGALAQLLGAPRQRVYLPFVGAITSLIVSFFVGVMVFGRANPFARLPFTPLEGNGLNPQLQNPGMVFHPPFLYLGYVSLTIPYAFAMAALLARRLTADWLAAIRKWTTASWLFLSIGILLGMWWAYVELGWGGYWAWDPVENASLVPWLTITAFLHSVMVQEKRGMLKQWNLALLIGSWLLSILGAFITRSGVLASVHSFAQSNAGYSFLALLALAAGASFWLFSRRLQLLGAETTLESMVSREGILLFNNLLLVGIAFSVLWGTLFPIVSEVVTGTTITVGPPFFNQLNVPLGVALLAVTGIGPLVAWRRSSVPNLRRHLVLPALTGVLVLLGLLNRGVRDPWAVAAIALAGFVLATLVQELARGIVARHRRYREGWAVACGRLLARNRRRSGGYVVHAGIVMLFVAFAGLAFRTESAATLRPGESTTLQSPYGWTYTFTHLGVSQYDALNREITAATVEVARDGVRLGILTTEKRQHVDALGRATFQPSTEAGIWSDPREDLYLVLAGVVNGTEQAVLRIMINPLVWWVWAGGAMVVMGGLVVLWPGAGGAAPRRAPRGHAPKLAEEIAQG